MCKDASMCAPCPTKPMQTQSYAQYAPHKKRMSHTETMQDRVDTQAAPVHLTALASLLSPSKIWFILYKANT